MWTSMMKQKALSDLLEKKEFYELLGEACFKVSSFNCPSSAIFSEAFTEKIRDMIVREEAEKLANFVTHSIRETVEREYSNLSYNEVIEKCLED